MPDKLITNADAFVAEVGKLAGKPVKQRIEDKVLARIKQDVAMLLDEDWPKAMHAYQQAIIAKDDEGTAFKVGVVIVLTPAGDGIQVECRTSYGVRYCTKTAPVIATNQPELFEPTK